MDNRTDAPQVDTAVPRSTWVHPYKDEQYLREHGHKRREKQNIRRHSSASQGIASPVIVGVPQSQQCADGQPARKKMRLASSPESPPSSSAHDDITVRNVLYRREIPDFDGFYFCFGLARTGAIVTPRFFFPRKILPCGYDCIRRQPRIDC